MEVFKTCYKITILENSRDWKENSYLVIHSITFVAQDIFKAPWAGSEDLYAIPRAQKDYDHDYN